MLVAADSSKADPKGSNASFKVQTDRTAQLFGEDLS